MTRETRDDDGSRLHCAGPAAVALSGFLHHIGKLPVQMRIESPVHTLSVHAIGVAAVGVILTRVVVLITADRCLLRKFPTA
jgi:hypothetical protein